ncbi:MAG: TetR/AcrR family transcriptional regulator [Gammaproteobacteria bacterium]|nr:TetR/AcrR family transcriptional regulator [Gammaproteobacteria bacterium]
MGRSEDKQEDIFNAAIDEFAEKGMIATTMESIAHKANVSKRTLYKYYPCKEDLLTTAVDKLLQRIEQLHFVDFDPQKELIEQLRNLGTNALQLTNDDDYLKLSKIVIIESMRSKKAAEYLDRKFRQCESGIHHWFQQASDAGMLGKMDARVAGEIFYGAIRKFTYWDQAIRWKEKLSDEEADQLIEDICQFFVKGCSQK